MSAPMRRGACPRLAAPMSTGDGLLARLAPAGTVGLDAVAGLCASARHHGNGILEITRRGSIQIRGLTATSAPLLADDVAALDIDLDDGVPIICGPLSGLDPAETADANDLAAALRAALASEHLGLGAKNAVVIDGGGMLHLDELAADVRLRAARHRGRIVWHVAVGGGAMPPRAVGSVTPERAVAVVTNVLRAIATRGPEARADDLIQAQDEDLRRRLAELLVDAPPPPARPAAEPIGIHVLRDGCVALGFALPFGHVQASALERLIDAAHVAGASGARTSPGRAVLLVGLAPGAAECLRVTGDRLGFIVRPDDPRRFIAACAGAPICGSGKIPARAIGPVIADMATPMLDGTVVIHLSGCAKGCAHSGAAVLTLVGTDDGCGLVVDGATGDRPVTCVATEALPAGIERLARDVSRLRGPGETSADVLVRLGATLVAEACHG